MVALSGAVAFGMVCSLRLSTPFDAIFVAMGILTRSVNWWVLLYPKEVIRTVAIPLTFLVFAL